MKTETYLVVIAALAILVMGAALAMEAVYQHGTAGSTTQPVYITVSAQGFSYGSPTQALLYLSLNGSGPTPTIATSNASLTVQKLNYSILRFMDGNASMMKTLSYSLFKEANSSQYEVVERLRAKIPDIENASAAIDAISAFGNVYIDSVSAVLSDSQISVMRNHALADALSNATSQARALAGNATVRVRNITVNSYSVFPYAFSGSTGIEAKSPAGMIYAGQDQVSESITVTFAQR